MYDEAGLNAPHIAALARVTLKPQSVVDSAETRAQSAS
jgi:hypothetical protein